MSPYVLKALKNPYARFDCLQSPHKTA